MNSSLIIRTYFFFLSLSFYLTSFHVSLPLVHFSSPPPYFLSSVEIPGYTKEDVTKIYQSDAVTRANLYRRRNREQQSGPSFSRLDTDLYSRIPPCENRRRIWPTRLIKSDGAWRVTSSRSIDLFHKGAISPRSWNRDGAGLGSTERKIKRRFFNGGRN